MSELLDIDHVCLRYNTEHDLALRNITLRIFEGENIAIVGHNGSGKSTLAKVICGVLQPTSGKMDVNGLNICDENYRSQISRYVSIVFQNPDNQIVAPTVEDDVAFSLENIGTPREEMIKRVQESISKLGLSGLEKTDPHHLSGGQKQRVALAGALAMRPKILVLDEATSMLDPKGRAEVQYYLNKINVEDRVTIISITHDLSVAMKADRIIVMKEGAIVADEKPSMILTNDHILKETSLKKPFMYEIIGELQARGVNFPETIHSEEELVSQLCKLKQRH
ncbi:energy-coupling factor transporter ATPase [Evansella cellulosilytica]|uniref:ABC transporter related protein n=1 Tax=Evansella cellulosilytica (strain ATCC 21833 / DSM 2522 / FERM P-1141 / JCM 9156 / N-4) TaxID=649639 RepID=E6TTA2_EVAC2|nr:energy-coupling factor transporter ATPase [Evansella cellulosilytica]ADU28442.1 ABC transporter related protein [Evansella cellulosilytica DSM 2522]